jgi:hypothetical protein
VAFMDASRKASNADGTGSFADLRRTSGDDTSLERAGCYIVGSPFSGLALLAVMRDLRTRLTLVSIRPTITINMKHCSNI